MMSGHVRYATFSYHIHVVVVVVVVPIHMRAHCLSLPTLAHSTFAKIVCMCVCAITSTSLFEQIDMPLYDFRGWFSANSRTQKIENFKSIREFVFTADGLRVRTASDQEFAERVYYPLENAPIGNPPLLSRSLEIKSLSISKPLRELIEQARTPMTPLTEWLLGGPLTPSQQQVCY